MHDVESTPAILTTRKPPRVISILRSVLSIGLLVLIFGAIFPSFANYDSVWKSIVHMKPWFPVLLLVATAGVEILKAGAPATLLPGLGWGKSFVANEASSAVSNTIPGPSGTAMRYFIYKSWGFGASEFGRSTVVNSTLNNLLLLVMPAFAMALLATQGKIDSTAWTFTAIGLAVAVGAIVVVVLTLYNENFARRLGTLLGAIVTWARGLVGKPPANTIGEAVVNFRGDTIDMLRKHWHMITLVIVGKYFATFFIFFYSVRGVGLNRHEITIYEALAVYAICRLATVVEITPGGVGVNELIYAAALEFVVGDKGHDQAVAATFIYRALTYLAPLVLGAICYAIWRQMKRWRVDNNVPRDAALFTAGFNNE